MREAVVSCIKKFDDSGGDEKLHMAWAGRAPGHLPHFGKFLHIPFYKFTCLNAFTYSLPIFPTYPFLRSRQNHMFLNNFSPGVGTILLSSCVYPFCLSMRGKKKKGVPHVRKTFMCSYDSQSSSRKT